MLDVNVILECFMTSGSVQFTVQRNRVGVSSGLSAGEDINATMESTEGVTCVNKPTCCFSQLFCVEEC